MIMTDTEHTVNGLSLNIFKIRRKLTWLEEKIIPDGIQRMPY